MKRDQKGFTIVELLIAVAILSIVIASVCGFILVGSRSYAAGNSDINVQQESQLALNQMSDVMIDTTRSVNYVGYDAGGNTETALKDAEFSFTPEDKSLILFNGVVEKDSGGGADTLKAGNGNKHYRFYWNKEKETLFYAEQDVVDTVVKSEDIINAFPDVADADPEAAGWYKLASHVTDFSVDLSQLEEKRVVQLALTFTDGKKEYITSNNVTIRNKVGVNDVELAPLNRRVEIDIAVKPSVLLEPHEDFTLPAPTVTGKNVTDKSVEWSIVSAVDEDVSEISKDWDPRPTQFTDSANGMLHLSRHVKGSFKVRATTNAKDSDGNQAFADMTVYIKRVTNITLRKSADTNPANEANQISPGCTFTVSAEVTGDHLGEVCDCCGEDTSIDKHILSTKNPFGVGIDDHRVWRVWSPWMDGLQDLPEYQNWHPEDHVKLISQDEYSATFYVEPDVPDGGTHGYVIQAVSLLSYYTPPGNARSYGWVMGGLDLTVKKGKTDISLGGNLNWGASTDLTASFEPMKFHYYMICARVREYGTAGKDKIMIFLSEGKTTRVTPDMFGVETINKPWYLSLQALEPKEELPKGVGWGDLEKIDSYYKVDHPAVKAMIDDYLGHCDASGTYIGTEYNHTGKLETTIYPPEILYSYNGQDNLEGELKLQPVSILEGNPQENIQRNFKVGKVKNTRDMDLGEGFANDNVKFSIYRETDGKREEKALYGYNGATRNYEGQENPYGEALKLAGIRNAKNVIIELDHNRRYNFSQAVGKYRLIPTIIYTQGSIADHYNGGSIYYADYSPQYEKEQYYEDERSTVYFEVVGGGNVDPFWSYYNNQFTKGEIYFPTPSEAAFASYFEREQTEWKTAKWWSEFTKTIVGSSGMTTYQPSSIKCRYVADKKGYELELFYNYYDTTWNRNIEISAGVFCCAADGDRWIQRDKGPYDNQLPDVKPDGSTADVDFWMNGKHYKGKIYLPLPSESSFTDQLGFDKESRWEVKDGVNLMYQPAGQEGVHNTDTMRLKCNYDTEKKEYTIQMWERNSANGEWEYRAAFLCKSNGTRWRQV